MVDASAATIRAKETTKIKSLMGRTPSIIKSKFLTVIGSSNELLTELSNKIDVALSLSSNDTELTDDNQKRNCGRHASGDSTPDDEHTVDLDIIDLQSRRVKERRAHEEVLSGRYRTPNIVPKHNLTVTDYEQFDLNNPSSSSVDSEPGDIHSNATESIDSLSLNAGDTVCRHPKSPAIDVTSASDHSGASPHLRPVPEVTGTGDKRAMSSISTSEYEPKLRSVSLESSDLKGWVRSDSTNSVPSWASSFSLDSQTDEAIVDFMRDFVHVLFDNSVSITLEHKSEFGQLARFEAGRLWFARLINARRAKSKRVDESTFYSLIQYFAIVLFECHESEDFLPAKSLMNMCFTFYHEVEVPGCEPYREYLYTYLREQPIWHSVRFWNAAFFDAIQCQRAQRPPPALRVTVCPHRHTGNDNGDSDSDSEAEPESVAVVDVAQEIEEDSQFYRNITFGQLGTFTCNMHAFGLCRELCTDFLKKQSTIASLTKDQDRLLRDNLSRMYRETEKWSDR